MTDMISVVARAIAKADEHYGGWPYEKRVGEKLASGYSGREILLDEAKAAIEAHEKALEQQGLVIVPREPTQAMVKAGAATEGMQAVDGMITFAFVHGLKLPEGEPPPLLQAWQAMLAALEGKDEA